METWEMRQHRIQAKARKEKIKSVLSGVVGSVLLLLVTLEFCWLCCAASGYHLEQLPRTRSFDIISTVNQMQRKETNKCQKPNRI